MTFTNLRNTAMSGVWLNIWEIQHFLIVLCGRGSPKTSFPLGWSFLKKNCIILPRRNAPGIVRKCFWKQCFTDLGACRCETRHNCESNTFLAVQSICNGRRDKDVPGSAQTVPLSAGPARWKQGPGGACVQIQDCQADPVGTGWEELPAEKTEGWVYRGVLLTREIHRKHFKVNVLWVVA